MMSAQTAFRFFGRHVSLIGMLFPVFLIASMTAPWQAWAQQSAKTESVQTRTLVARIQAELSAIGFDAGPADGIIGTKTRDAIRAFQRQQKMTETGRPEADLLIKIQTVRSELQKQKPVVTDTPNTVAEISPLPANPASEPVNIIGKLWSLNDSIGGHQIIRFTESGTVIGPINPDNWKWKVEGNQITITFRSPWYGNIVRTGTISEDRLEGSAISSDGRQWQWYAVVKHEAGQSKSPWPRNIR